MRKKRKLVEVQELDEINGGPDSYSRYVALAPDKALEDVLANPDCLPEQASSPSTPQLLMGEAIQHLQGRQREVYLLVMREDKSFAEVGEVLGIGKSTAQEYLDRAIKFITGYCHEAEERGRI